MIAQILLRFADNIRTQISSTSGCNISNQQFIFFMNIYRNFYFEFNFFCIPFTFCKNLMRKILFVEYCFVFKSVLNSLNKIEITVEMIV